MSISLQEQGTAVTSTITPQDVAFPVTGLTADDLFVLLIADKHGVTPSATDFSLQGSVTAGSGTGVDAGAAEVHILTKVATGGETGNLSVTLTGINVARCMMVRLRKTGGTWNFQWRSGVDEDLDLAMSCTGASAEWANGDYFIGAASCNGNLIGFPQITLSASGITFGTATNLTTASTSTGNDMAWSFVSQTVTAAGSASPNATSTLTGTPTGSTPIVATGFLVIGESAVGGGTTSANLINSNLIAGRLLRGLKG